MALKKLLTVFLPAMAVASAAAAHDIGPLAVSGFNVDCSDSVITVTMTVDPAAMRLGREESLPLTPVIYGADSTMSVRLDSVCVVGRNRYYRECRAGSRAAAPVLRAGSDAPYTCRASVRRLPWMELSTVAVATDLRGCCGKPQSTASVPVAEIDLRPRTFSRPVIAVEAPPATDSKTVELSGRAYIDFRVNRTEIDPDYRKNPVELGKILATINTVRDNPDATVTDITIKGYASPEGSYANNTRLAKGRTASLRGYVAARYPFPASVFHDEYEPEDWAGLRDSVAASALPRRQEILAVIDSDLAPDARDAELRRRFPAEYKYLLENIYPALRRSDYRVRYNIRQYTDIDEIRRVMRTRPGNLSLSEFYLLASSYPVGSDEYNEVFETAARIYPDDPVSNYNAAAVAVNRGEFATARACLDRVPASPATDYMTGVMLACEGRLAEARTALARAADAGVKGASEPLARVDELSSVGEPVRYLPYPAAR